MSCLELDIIRVTGSALGGARESVLFQVTLDSSVLRAPPRHLLRRTSSSPAASPSKMQRPAIFQTTTRKRGYNMFSRSSNETTLEFGEHFEIPIEDLSSAQLTIICVKGGKRIGVHQINLQSLPQQRDVEKWFQLRGPQNRNVDALVMLRLRLVDDVPSSGRMGRHQGSIHVETRVNNDKVSSPNQERARNSRAHSLKAKSPRRLPSPLKRSSTFRSPKKATGFDSSSDRLAGTLRAKLMRSNSSLMPKHELVEAPKFEDFDSETGPDVSVSKESASTGATYNLIDYFLAIGFEGQEDVETIQNFLSSQKQHGAQLQDASSNSSKDSQGDPSSPKKPPQPPARVLHSWPETEHENFPVPPLSHLICFPDSVTLSDKYRPPVCFGFYLSTSKAYGNALVYWKVFDQGSPDSPNSLSAPSSLSLGSYLSSSPSSARSSMSRSIPISPSNSSSGAVLFIPTAFIFISRVPFCFEFGQILSAVYHRFVTGSFTYTNAADSLLSMEEIITFLTTRVVAPRIGGPAVSIQDIAGLNMRFELPSGRYHLPSLPYSLIYLLRVLDLRCILDTLSALLTGRSIVVQSSQLSMLTPVCECFLSMIAPLRWSNLYIPLLPAEALPVLESPVPFIVGASKSLIEPHHEQRNDVVFVDIDMSLVRSSAPLPLMPPKCTDTLYSRLRRLSSPQVQSADQRSITLDPTSIIEQNSFALVQKNHRVEKAIRREFLTYITSVLRGYREYLSFDASNTPVFDTAGFLEERSDARPFLSRLMQTMCFSNFVNLHKTEPSYLADFVAYALPDENDLADIVYKPPSCFEATAPSSVSIGESHIDRVGASIGWHGLSSSALRSCTDALLSDNVGNISCPYVAEASVSSESAFDYKHKMELGKINTKCRVVHAVSRLLHGRDVEVGEICSVLQLVRGHSTWRSALTHVLSALPSSTSTLQLATRAFDKLSCVFFEALEGSYEQNDFDCARHLLRYSMQLYFMDDSKRQYIRDEIKGARIWNVQRFWSYMLSIELLCRPGLEPQTSSTRDDAPPIRITRTWSLPTPEKSFETIDNMKDDSHVLMRSASGTLLAVDPELLRRSVPEPRAEGAREAWPDFVFSSICSILCTLQALGIAEDMAKTLSMNLARAQRLDQQQCQDLFTLIANIYRLPFHADSIGSAAELEAPVPAASPLGRSVPNPAAELSSNAGSRSVSKVETNPKTNALLSAQSRARVRAHRRRSI